jgi:hypothetical protein
MAKIINKKVIVVIGMHRSGTSVIAKSLDCLGVSLGDNLMPPHEQVNPRGFFEDLDINSLNIEILDALGHTWSSISRISDEEFSRDDLLPLKDKAKNVLLRKTENVEFFAFKDPRSTKLLPFWQSVFNDLRVEVKYVIAVRNPLSVAMSLKRRDGFDLNKSYYLWLDHFVQSYLKTQDYPRVFVDYDLIIENPCAELNRIAFALKLNFNKFSGVFKAFERDFLEVGFRNSKFSIKDLEGEVNIPTDIIEAYLAALKLSRDESVSEWYSFKEKFDRINDRLISKQFIFNYLDSQDTELTNLRSRIFILSEELNRTSILLNNHLSENLKPVEAKRLNYRTFIKVNVMNIVLSKLKNIF